MSAEEKSLAEKLDEDIDQFMEGLPKRPYRDGWPEEKWQEVSNTITINSKTKCRLPFVIFNFRFLMNHKNTFIVTIYLHSGVKNPVYHIFMF